MIGTDPSAGTSVAKGSSITVIVSSGSAPVPVPDVTGKSETDAQSQLVDLGLKVQTQDVAVTRPGPGRRRPEAVARPRHEAEEGRHRDAPDRATRRRVTEPRRIRVAVLRGGRSSEHDVSLRLRRVGARGARPRALRRRADHDRPRRRLGAPVRPARVAPPRRGASDRPGPRRRRRPARAGTARRRRRPARPPRPVRRGRHRAGPLRARSAPPTSARACSARRSRWTRRSARPCCGTRGSPSRASVVLHAHRDHPDDPALERRLAAELGYPLFVKPARLGSSVGISKVHDASELPAALALGPRARRQGARRGAPRRPRGRVRRARQRGAGRLRRRRDQAARRVVRLRGEVRDRRLGHPDPGRSRPRRTSRASRRRRWRAFRACDLAGMARIDYFLRRDGDARPERDQHDPGLHRDERLRSPLRGERHPVRAPARSPDRARARAARAAVEAAGPSRSAPMRALVKRVAERGLWLEDVPEPTYGINDVLIRVAQDRDLRHRPAHLRLGRLGAGDDPGADGRRPRVRRRDRRGRLERARTSRRRPRQRRGPRRLRPLPQLPGGPAPPVRAHVGRRRQPARARSPSSSRCR